MWTPFPAAPGSVPLPSAFPLGEQQTNVTEITKNDFSPGWVYRGVTFPKPQSHRGVGCVDIVARVRASQWPETTAALCVEKPCDTRSLMRLGGGLLFTCAQVHLYFSRCQQGHVLGQNGHDCPVITVLGQPCSPGGQAACSAGTWPRACVFSGGGKSCVRLTAGKSPCVFSFISFS